MLWLLIFALAHAAPDDTYWALRDRLDTEFLLPGEDPGDSLPAAHRTDAAGEIKWADTTVLQGWYLGTLAIEYALLRDGAVDGFGDGRDAQDTATELALALHAVDRLDTFSADAFPDCQQPGILDGFFVRDDVPADFGVHFDGVTHLESDWTDSNPWLKEMSQDQAIHLWMGLALVRHFASDAVVDGVNLGDEAAAAGGRIGTHVAADGTWLITNPACDDKRVERGADARFFSTGMAAAIAEASGQPAPAEGLYPDLWEALRDPSNPGFVNSDNRHMVLALEGTGDSWADGFGDLLAVSGVEHWDAYPLVYLALHGTPVGHTADLQALDTRVWTDLQSLGDAEPAATWPDPASHPWTTWNRYIRPADEQGAPDEGHQGQRYSGLDYMLLFDLHAAVFRARWPSGSAKPAAPCGCRTGPPAGWGGLLLAMLLLLRRRAR